MNTVTHARQGCLAFGRDVEDGTLALNQVADAIAVIGAVGVNDAAPRQGV